MKKLECYKLVTIFNENLGIFKRAARSENKICEPSHLSKATEFLKRADKSNRKLEICKRAFKYDKKNLNFSNK